MSVLLSCPKGHQWRADEGRAGSDTCPVCGASGETVIEEGDTSPAAGDDLPPGPRASGAGEELPPAFGRYKIVKLLGRGGMGAVYLAHDSQLDRQVALKVPRFRDGDATLRERFQREARAAATLDHPNICSVYDVGEFQGVQFLSMAYVEGQPLSKLIQDQHPLPQTAVADLVRKLALAMQEAHEHHVVHRDLKPANIMINKRHEPVIMDFGLARRDNTCDTRLTAAGAVMGTPDYMAPEQVAGDTEKIGAATDIYALGVILYQLLTGRLPFEGSAGEVMGQISLQPPTPPSQHRPDIDPAWESICLKALSKQADERHSSMGEFAAALDEVFAARHDARSERPPAAQPAGSADGGTQAERPPESRASELLQRLAARLQSGQGVTVEHRIRGVWPMVAAVSMAILLFALLLWAPWRQKTVTVHLIDIDIWMNNPDVTFVLDREPVSREVLAQPLRLRPGPHVLEVRQGERTEAVYDIPVAGKSREQKVALRDHRREPSQTPGVGQGPAPKEPEDRPSKGPPGPPRPPSPTVDAAFAIEADPYYGSQKSSLQSTLVINDQQVSTFANATRQCIAQHLRAGWNRLVLETTPLSPAESSNYLRFHLGRVAKSPEGEPVMSPAWFFSNGQGWKLDEGRFTHQLGPDVQKVRLSCQLFYAGFEHEDLELTEGDYVLETRAYFSNENPSVTATVSVNGTQLTTFGSSPRRAVITDLLRKGENIIKLDSRRVEDCLKDNEIYISVSGPAEHNVSRDDFDIRPVAMLGAMTGWQRDKQKAQLVSIVDPKSDKIERTIRLHLPDEPRRSGRTPDAPEMMVWVDKYYGRNSDNPLHSELRINGQLISHFTSDTRESIAGALKKNDWNEVTLRTIPQYPAARWDELQLSFGLARRELGELTMEPTLWYINNGGHWKYDDGRLTHQLRSDDVTLKLQLFFAGLDAENKQPKEGDYVLEGKPYYARDVTAVTSTIVVNGTTLNSFASLPRQVVITPFLKNDKNTIELITKRVDGCLKENDITFLVKGPGEYFAGEGKPVFPEIAKFDSLTGWRRDPRSGQLNPVEDPDSDTIVRQIEFNVDQLP